MSNQQEKILILDNIRSTHNVGSIFRTADAVGISKIYLVGVTPAPIDRFGRERNDISKVALGAEKNIKWEHIENILDIIGSLKKEGFEIVALEQSENSVDYKEFVAPNKMALILGEEVSGIEKETLDVCDSIIEIPMRGEKESLNVSVATGVALFRILNI